MNQGIIYFVSAWLASDVHVQALGFTSYLPMFAWGLSEVEAARNVHAYLTGAGAVVKKIADVKPCHIQDPARLCYPEQVCGIPEEIALECITAAFAEVQPRELREDWIAGDIRKFRARQSMLAAGLNQLAAPAV